MSLPKDDILTLVTDESDIDQSDGEDYYRYESGLPCFKQMDHKSRENSRPSQRKQSRPQHFNYPRFSSVPAMATRSDDNPPLPHLLLGQEIEKPNGLTDDDVRETLILDNQLRWAEKYGKTLRNYDEWSPLLFNITAVKLVSSIADLEEMLTDITNDPITPGVCGIDVEFVNDPKSRKATDWEPPIPPFHEQSEAWARDGFAKWLSVSSGVDYNNWLIDLWSFMKDHPPKFPAPLKTLLNSNDFVVFAYGWYNDYLNVQRLFGYDEYNPDLDWAKISTNIFVAGTTKVIDLQPIHEQVLQSTGLRSIFTTPHTDRTSASLSNLVFSGYHCTLSKTATGQGREWDVQTSPDAPLRFRLSDQQIEHAIYDSRGTLFGGIHLSRFGLLRFHHAMTCQKTSKRLLLIPEPYPEGRRVMCSLHYPSENGRKQIIPFYTQIDKM